MRLTACVAAAVLLLGTCPAVSAQSLADLAKKEEERRKSAAPAQKSYSNKDLAFDPAMVSAERLEKALPHDRPKIAATQFMGYYLKHTRGYSDYCQQNWGIDLGMFLKAFSEAHRTEYAKAQQIVTDMGLTEEKVWSTNEPLLRESVAREMTEIPGTRGSMAGCNGLNKAATTLSTNFHFSKVFPDAHKALIGPPAAR